MSAQPVDGPRPARPPLPLARGVLAAVQDLVGGSDPAYAPSWADAERRDVIAALDRAGELISLYRARVIAAHKADGRWARSGDRSFENHRARTARTGVGAARAEAALGEGLAELPQAARAVEDGRVGLAHAGVLTRLRAGASEAVRAALDAGGAAHLLDLARTLDVATFAKRAAAWAAAHDVAAAEAAFESVRERRYSRAVDRDGGVKIDAFVDPLVGASWRTMMDALTPVPAAGDTRTPDQRAADALDALLERAMAMGNDKVGAQIRPHISLLVPAHTWTRRGGERSPDADRTAGRTCYDGLGTCDDPSVAEPAVAFLVPLAAGAAGREPGTAGREPGTAGREPGTAGQPDGTPGTSAPTDARPTSATNATHGPEAGGRGGTTPPRQPQPTGAANPSGGTTPIGQPEPTGAPPPTGAAAGGATPSQQRQGTGATPSTGQAGHPSRPVWLPELDDGTVIPWSVLDRIACDCEMTRLVLDADGIPLDVGRSQRTYTRELRRAVLIRDGHCRWPGCTMRASWCEVHHVRPYGSGGVTSSDNAITLCSFHHHEVHRRGVIITPLPNGHTFTRADGFTIGTTTRDAGVTRLLTPPGGLGAARGDAGGSHAGAIGAGGPLTRAGAGAGAGAGASRALPTVTTPTTPPGTNSTAAEPALPNEPPPPPDTPGLF